MSDNKLDVETIEVLKDALADEFPALINTFIDDAPIRIGDMKKLLQAGDIAEIERPAHTLKGSSGNIGAHALSEACSVLVEEIRSDAATDAEQRIKDIEAEFDLVKTMLQAMLD